MTIAKSFPNFIIFFRSYFPFSVAIFCFFMGEKKAKGFPLQSGLVYQFGKNYSEQLIWTLDFEPKP
ncbi:MAG: hypothetical protein DI529_01905 [Chryseobacterium sp.]|nr:MAG: hypothetical protein DI529_01905 [Chryseobacterium sp.]